MSIAGEEHHSPNTFGHVFAVLIAGALALTAAYLWLTDGPTTVALPVSVTPTPTPLATNSIAPAPAPVLAPTPIPAAAPTLAPEPEAAPQAALAPEPTPGPTVAPIVVSPVEPPVVQIKRSLPVRPPVRTIARPQPPLAPPPLASTTSNDRVIQTSPVDPQVAADAAAVGMTSRVRPAESAHPGQ